MNSTNIKSLNEVFYKNKDIGKGLEEALQEALVKAIEVKDYWNEFHITLMPEIDEVKRSRMKGILIVYSIDENLTKNLLEFHIDTINITYSIEVFKNKIDEMLTVYEPDIRTTSSYMGVFREYIHDWAIPHHVAVELVGK